MGGMIIITVVAIGLSIITLCKMRRQKKDIYDFADRIERNLDAIISNKTLENILDTEESLRGKIGEKLQRVSVIWEKKELESKIDKEIMKELISDISHQIKTPLANQRIYIEILSSELLTEKGRECVESLEKQANKLEFLFQSMVKTSRLETGSILIIKQDTDLYNTLGKATSAVVLSASKKQIDLFVECEEKIFLLHDAKWTEEAIFNILDNAIKYTKAKGSIHIAVIKQDLFTRISVKDSGKGIALERQAQIFTRFYREPEVHDQEGIGIGLFLARKIIELQDGYLEVSSEPGQGSEFCIYLPNN